MNYQEKVELHERAKRIVASSLSWKEKYDMIFSSDVSDKVDFDWYDPDMDYEDDVRAFMVGFQEYMVKQSIIEREINY